MILLFAEWIFALTKHLALIGRRQSQQPSNLLCLMKCQLLFKRHSMIFKYSPFLNYTANSLHPRKRCHRPYSFTLECLISSGGVPVWLVYCRLPELLALNWYSVDIISVPRVCFSFISWIQLLRMSMFIPIWLRRHFSSVGGLSHFHK